MNKTKAHIRYETKDGVKVPGVTTVLSVLNKPALVKWANNLGLKGIDSNKYRDKMADIGTLAHLMILNFFKGNDPIEYAEFSKEDIDKAENCLISFYNWIDENDVEPLVVEEPFISERFLYGGTIDCYCKLNGMLTLVDFKTGKALYDEMFYQVAAYKNLLEENGKKVDQVRILRIGRAEDEGFEDRTCPNLKNHWDIFYNCLKIYEIKNKIKNGSDDFYQFTLQESAK